MSLVATVELLLIFSTITGIFLQTVNGISCYQCVSTDHTNPFQCNEYLEDVDLVPESCDAVYGAQHCIKHTGRFEGGLGTKRFCSSLDLGNYCNYIQQPGDELEYRSCVYTCSSDGCNPASTLRMPSLMAVTAVSLLSVLYVRLQQ